MSNVGLLYSSAALIINGLVLLGLVSSRAAAPLNLLVGSMQVIFPTVVLVQAEGDLAAILSASSVYLFGVTYLYVGLNALTGASGEGLGWFSLFVTVCAVVYSVLEFLSGGSSTVAGPGRPVVLHHPMELSVRDGHVQDRACPGRGLHGGHQAG